MAILREVCYYTFLMKACVWVDAGSTLSVLNSRHVLVKQ